MINVTKLEGRLENNKYFGHWKSAALTRIQIIELRCFVPKFLPLYQLVAALNLPTHYAAAGG